MAKSDPYDDPNFGRSANNRYLCQLGSLRDPELSKGDALGRGLLNDANGHLNPFKLEELFHRSLINAFSAISNWDDMAFFDKTQALDKALAQACKVVGIPRIQTYSVYLASRSTNLMEFDAGSWVISLKASALMNNEERKSEKHRDLWFVNERNLSESKRQSEIDRIVDLYSRPAIPRVDVITALCHECEHALQNFMSLCSVAGHGFTGDFRPTGSHSEMFGVDYAAKVDGRLHVTRPDVWDVAKQHPTQHPYATAVSLSGEQDLGFWALIRSPNVPVDTQNALRTNLYDPRSPALSKENGAARIESLVAREVRDTAWIRRISQSFRPGPAVPPYTLFTRQDVDARETWQPPECVTKPIVR